MEEEEIVLKDSIKYKYWQLISHNTNSRSMRYGVFDVGPSVSFPNYFYKSHYWSLLMSFKDSSQGFLKSFL